MSLQIETMEKDGVTLAVKDNALHISGNISSQNPGEFMDPFLMKFHTKIVESNIKEITVDVRELSFLNSAGIRSLVDWILLMEELTEEKKYKITILYSAKYQWQKTSINSFTYLSPGLVNKKEG